jgi:hypothetical protein
MPFTIASIPPEGSTSDNPGGDPDVIKAFPLGLHFPHTSIDLCGMMSMRWRFFEGLVFGLFSGCLAMSFLYLTAHPNRATIPLADSDYSSQKFSSLSAEEINRRTLKAAAAIGGYPRRY